VDCFTEQKARRVGATGEGDWKMRCREMRGGRRDEGNTVFGFGREDGGAGEGYRGGRVEGRQGGRKGA
jgi:hypothetical protein